jgi:hypothetical protein
VLAAAIGLFRQLLPAPTQQPVTTLNCIPAQERMDQPGLGEAEREVATRAWKECTDAQLEQLVQQSEASFDRIMRQRAREGWCPIWAQEQKDLSFMARYCGDHR